MSEVLLSIVIPVFNREREVRRALASCLAQEFEDYEIVVADDGSTDRTASVIREYEGPRVRAVLCQSNGGPWHARNAALAAARGQWILTLDSDDELLPGALSTINREIVQAPSSLHRLGFMFRYLDGRISPYPPPSGAVLHYGDFLQWLDNSRMYDCLTITRRSTFAIVPWPGTPVSGMLYHLEFTRRFATRWIPEVLAIVHTDAHRRVSRTHTHRLHTPSEQASSDLDELRQIFELHGDSIQRLAPCLHRVLSSRRAVCLGLAGERRSAIRDAAAQLRANPYSPLHWAVLLGVLTGPRAIRFAQAIRWRLIERHRKRVCQAPPDASPQRS